MVEGRDAGCGHSQQYFSVRHRWFWKIYKLQPIITTEFFRSYCTHIRSPFLMGYSAAPTQYPCLKQAGAIRDSSPGHFETIRFSQQLDLSILSHQATKEELMNGSSRFARHCELVFAKGLLGSIDQHLDILEFQVKRSRTNWKKPAIASRPLYCEGTPNVAR